MPLSLQKLSKTTRVLGLISRKPDSQPKVRHEPGSGILPCCCCVFFSSVSFELKPTSLCRSSQTVKGAGNFQFWKNKKSFAQDLPAACSAQPAGTLCFKHFVSRGLLASTVWVPRQWLATVMDQCGWAETGFGVLEGFLKVNKQKALI